MAVLVAAACGSPLRKTMPRVDATQVDESRRMPLGPSSRERLRALPQVATYRWGAPSTHFRGITPAEDSAAAAFSAHELRTFGASVLRTNGWYEATQSVPAEYELSIVSFERSVAQTVDVVRTGPQPVTRPEEWSRCARVPPAQRSTCVEPMPQTTPTTTRTDRVRTVVPQRFTAFAIMRLADSSTVWWITQRREDLLTAQVRLLAAPPEQ